MKCLYCNDDFQGVIKELNRGKKEGNNKGKFCSRKCARTYNNYKVSYEEIKYNLTDIEIAWIAGLLEGEGSFLLPPPSNPSQVSIGIQMTDKDILERLQNYIGGSISKAKKQKEHHKQSYALRIWGRKAEAIMELVYPYMGARRKERINECLEFPKKRREWCG